LSIKPKQV